MSSWGPAAPHPPTPELLPRATGSVGVSNSVRFHLHDLQPTGSEGSKNFWLRLRGSDGEGILSHSDRTLFPPSASPHTKLAGRGGDRTPPPGSVGCQGPPARGAQPCVWFSHSRDQVWGPLGSFRDTASARPAQALLQASKAQEWAGVWTAAGETLRFLEETGGRSDSRQPSSPHGLPSPHPGTLARTQQPPQRRPNQRAVPGDGLCRIWEAGEAPPGAGGAGAERQRHFRQAGPAVCIQQVRAARPEDTGHLVP